jgi:hypothetical protein
VAGKSCAAKPGYAGTVMTRIATHDIRNERITNVSHLNRPSRTSKCLVSLGEHRRFMATVSSCVIGRREDREWQTSR